MAEELTTLEIMTTLPETVETMAKDANNPVAPKRNRPRVSLEKWALFQNEKFPELFYKSIKAMIKDKSTHHLKMSQIMKMLETPDIMTPLGKIRKRSRSERLIWFPKRTVKSFELKDRPKRTRKAKTPPAQSTETLPLGDITPSLI